MKEYESTGKLMLNGLRQNYQQMRIYCLKKSLPRVHGIIFINLK